jgi:uncharacterized protein YjbI with pentapeptide repeats
VADADAEIDLASGDFRGRHFRSGASFVGLHAEDLVDFTGATFDGPASFSGARFDAGVVFDDATFNGVAEFGPSYPRPPDAFELLRFGGPVEALGAGGSDGHLRIVGYRPGSVEQSVRLDGTRAYLGRATAALVTRATTDPGSPLVAYGIAGDEAWATEVRAASYGSEREVWRRPIHTTRSLIAGVLHGPRFLFAHVRMDGRLDVVDLRSDTPVVPIRPASPASCTALALSVLPLPDGDAPVLAAGFADGTVRAFSADTGAEFVRVVPGGEDDAPLARHDRAVTRVSAFVDDTLTVVSVGDDNTLRQTALHEPAARPPLSLTARPTAVAVHPRENGDHLAIVGGADGTLAVLGLAGAGVYHVDPFGAHRAQVTDVLVAADDGTEVTIVSSDADGRVLRWKVTPVAGMTVTGNVSLRRARFAEDLRLARCRIVGTADLADCAVEGDATVLATSVQRLDLDRCRVQGRMELRRTAAEEGIELERAAITGGVVVEDCSASHVRLDAAQLPAGVVVSASRLDGGIDLRTARIGPSRLSGRRDQLLRVASLAGATLQGPVALQRVDLRGCGLGGASGLDKLVIASAEFNDRPQRLASPRRVIRDELGWRVFAPLHVRPAIVAGGRRWQGHRDAALTIARYYRELRKAYEDAKDEPGAADFYYGEMEMRKFSDRRPVRMLIWLYWLVSGYGLRPLRSIAVLAAVLLGAALVMTPGQVADDGGYVLGAKDARPGFGDALLDLAQVTVSLNPEGAGFSALGDALRVAVRILGPLLLGLTALALRGRVKR